MLELTTPILLGTYSYTRLVGGIKGEWDWRTRKINVEIALAREQDETTIIATHEINGEQTRLLAPPRVATLVLQDSSPSDPALVTVFQKLHELTEAIEAVIIANALLTENVYQTGEEEVTLACTFIATAEPGQIEENDITPEP